MGTTAEDGKKGFFVIPLSKSIHGVECFALCIVSDGEGEIPWEHVSARISEGKANAWKERTPTWEEMCAIKDTFWDGEEAVMQLHPAKSDYVNVHPHVLHLWKPTESIIPLPPIAAV